MNIPNTLIWFYFTNLVLQSRCISVGHQKVKCELMVQPNEGNGEDKVNMLLASSKSLHLKISLIPKRSNKDC